MANILEDYDLSGGEVYSSVVTDPGNINLSWKTENATDSDQIVVLEWYAQVDGEDYHLIKTEKRQEIISKIRGNESSNANVFGVNSTNLKIKVIPPYNAVGTLNLWALNN